ncbi:MAG: 30S ribosomal protein S12 methylthiotransferase RimO [Clostridia bacterium]|nr:30S ribosomal protein S12 methylthiotransferase RimO [Clostridia bacterium]
MKVGLVSLGCSKNQVDSEMILGLFKNYSIDITNEVAEADIIVVNTCGFIESAKKEAIDTILEMADYKKEGNCKTLIVTGCLAKRYKKQILETMPEVDLCIGVDEYNDIDKILSECLNQKLLNQNLNFNDRIISTNFPLAYIRISDGCDNRCSYCAIPLIRGNHVSRKFEDIVSEVQNLAAQGIQEFCLIAQDTSKYGLDLYGKLRLKDIIQKISKIEGVKWIRILYMYLYETTDELIEEIAHNPKVCPYFDIPIQHISNRMLTLMNRHDTKEIIMDRIKKIREVIPEAILRTTVITGFPGETQQDFDEMLSGIRQIAFDRLGAFAYSREEDTKSYHMKNQIKESTKEERLKKVFDVQKEISLKNNKKRIGKQYEVIVEDVSPDNQYFVCRSMCEAPDVDGRIYIKIDDDNVDKIIVGGFIHVEIIECNEYDLYAKIL